jgi:nitroreductase
MHEMPTALAPSASTATARGRRTVAKAPQALQRLLERHSIGPRWMVAPGPSPEQLHLAVRAALRAPDHGRLLPWRAVVIPDRERGALGELFAAFARDAGRTDEDVARERDRARNGPVLVAWIARIAADVDEVPPHEQWMCAGGALTNFLNALHLMGYGAKTLSGRKCSHPALARAFCADGEQLVAFVCIGTPTRKPAARVVDDADEVLSLWRAPAA